MDEPLKVQYTKESAVYKVQTNVGPVPISEILIELMAGPCKHCGKKPVPGSGEVWGVDMDKDSNLENGLLKIDPICDECLAKGL